MAIGILTLEIYLPGCSSLKEKRRRLKPFLVRLQREFNISVAEMDLNDTWQNAVIGCAVLSNNPAHAQKMLSKVSRWVERHWPDLEVISDHIELI